jgi:lactate dehydrogenase-like 2-hydroxyacid dehydrogenase
MLGSVFLQEVFVSRVLQLVPLPVPSYEIPADLGIAKGFELPSLDDWLRSNGSAVIAAVTHSLHGIPAELWSRLPSLRLVANFGVGLDRIDLATAAARDVEVTYTPDLLTNDVADLAIGFTLALLRRISAADKYVRQGSWGKEPFALGRSANGRRVGILGMGRIGKAIARRALAFNMQIGYLSRTAVDGTFERFTNPIELASWADVLIAALPGGEQTQHLVDAKVLAALGQSGLFVNIARGSVVDEDALVDALRRGVIAGAGLDVHERQPIDGSRYNGLENVLLTPHIGSSTLETRKAMADSVYGNVRALLSGGPLSDRVVRS